MLMRMTWLIKRREKFSFENTFLSVEIREKPEYLGTIHVDPNSPTYLKVIHRLYVPNLGDELHHSGWNSCSSSHGDSSGDRRFLMLPSLISRMVYIVNTKKNPNSPSLHKVVEPEEILAKT
ncbi:hypothetical protein SOVF_053580 [Spinacia oleracea]|uniref:Selenium-binding protein 2 n=1 Tax=Spinacia oleracea TaxID=3562 RepID=A0ABM3QGI4_SPIOL|nr:selenium-binding protein 2-like [Spinacia oleracea]XP_056682476.1 selenium-binding protein 2-like [Spinacia oleracea]XP_056682477.1 selenium-binding protein 2-like [Spinacia oleracea]KNA20307.1 hypothetical protein SOVF_053580 [Spinacia oleracea]